MSTIHANGIELAFDRLGDPQGDTIVLISGLTAQRVRWSDAFCERLAAHGFGVIRFDNRDAGESTHLPDRRAPDFAQLAGVLAQGRIPEVPYTLADMARDTIGLLDALGIERAHLVGRSMGGMIAQLVASMHPERVHSLVSIMSSSGNPTLPAATPATMALMTRPAPDPAIARDAYVEHVLTFARDLAGSGTPFDADAQRDIIREELRRAHDPGAMSRQLAAIAVDGDRRDRLATITAPTLVIHGTDDPLFPSAHGEDTAASIPNATLLLIDGMGHEIPSALNARIVTAIVENTRRAA